MEPKIHLIRERATQQQMDEMQRALGDRIKLAVDVERKFWQAVARFMQIVKVSYYRMGADKKMFGARIGFGIGRK
jgi:hypothetical protein